MASLALKKEKFSPVVMLLSFGLFFHLWIIQLALAMLLFVAHSKNVLVCLYFLSVVEKICHQLS